MTGGQSVPADVRIAPGTESVRPLDNRVVVVTGATGGIGRAVCEHLAQAGARVLAVDIHDVGAGSVGPTSGGPNGNASYVRADVSIAADVAAYVEHALSRFGRIDGLVNNAGIEGVITPTVNYPIDVFDRVLAVNVRGVFLGLKHVLPVMIEQRHGAIVNVASVAGMIGHSGHSAYVASKHAVIGMTRVAAAEVARYNVRVNAVSPGPTTTRMMAAIEDQAGGGDPEAAHSSIVAKIPAGRYGEPDEIARTIAFLLTDAASYIHGAVLAVDGGFTAAI